MDQEHATQPPVPPAEGPQLMHVVVGVLPLDHGSFLNIDNNAAERAMKRVAIGRKNQDVVEADVSSLTDDEYSILRWTNGIWEAVDGVAE